MKTPDEVLSTKDIIFADMKVKNEAVKAMEEYAEQFKDKHESDINELKEENRKLRFMIDNGLGYEDMKNDITYPNELRYTK